MGPKKNRSDATQVLKTTENTQTIPFVVWFYKKVKTNELRPHQDKEVRVYFDEKGLKENESESKFEDALKSF